MDTVFLEELVFSGRHGVMEYERTKAQRFGLSIRVEQDPTDWKDTIHNTYDYMDAYTIAQKIVEGESFKLIETLAERIAAEIMKNAKVQSVSITIRKLDLMPPAIAGISITRSRE